MIVHSFPSLPSTNSKAAELAGSGAPHATVVRALTQTAGRGRLGKQWCSPAGKGLYFSVIVRPDLSRENYPKLTMTAGLGVALALEAATGRQIMLKWPNDLMIDGKKCGGILCEAQMGALRQSDRFAVIGIGLNVNTAYEDFPAELRDKATSLRLAGGTGEYDPDSLLENLVGHVLKQVEFLEREGFAPILQQWRRRDFLVAKELDWLCGDGTVVHGRSEGPDEDGRLLVRDRQGRVHHVLSGDITLSEPRKKAADANASAVPKGGNGDMVPL